MIIDHIGIAVADHEKSKAFYCKALAPLDLEVTAENGGWVGFGKHGSWKAEFWFGEDVHAQNPMHIAFLADSRDSIDQFYDAAIKAGATDNGKPGIREMYHPNYYGAFVIDPDGHNIEAVYHGEESNK